MNIKNNYQPEDIEALLAEKPFHELYAEEKAFVLEHLSSANEYEQMRETLLSIRGASGNDSSSSGIRTSPRVKQELMAAFEKEKKKRSLIWWNSLGLFFRNQLRFDLPVVRIAFAAVVLLFGIWIVYRMTENTNVIKPELAKTETDKNIPVTIPANPAPNEFISKNLADTVNKTIPQPQIQDVKNPDDNGVKGFAVQPETPKRIAEIPSVNPNPPAVDSTKSTIVVSNGLVSSKLIAKRLPSQIIPDMVGPFSGNNMNNFSNMNSNNAGYTNNLFVNVNPVTTGKTVTDSFNTSTGFGSPVVTGGLNGSFIDTSLSVRPVTNTSVICSGGTTSLMTNGATSSYSWTPMTLNATSVTNLGTYSVTVTDANGSAYYNQIPKSRTLATDANAIDLFCELK